MNESILSNTVTNSPSRLPLLSPKRASILEKHQRKPSALKEKLKMPQNSFKRNFKLPNLVGKNYI
jgi:hypothetical protein